MGDISNNVQLQGTSGASGTTPTPQAGATGTLRGQQVVQRGSAPQPATNNTNMASNNTPSVDYIRIVCPRSPSLIFRAPYSEELMDYIDAHPAWICLVDESLIRSEIVRPGSISRSMRDLNEELSDDDRRKADSEAKGFDPARFGIEPDLSDWTIAYRYDVPADSKSESEEEDDDCSSSSSDSEAGDEDYQLNRLDYEESEDFSSPSSDSSDVDDEDPQRRGHDCVGAPD